MHYENIGKNYSTLCYTHIIIHTYTHIYYKIIFKYWIRNWKWKVFSALCACARARARMCVCERERELLVFTTCLSCRRERPISPRCDWPQPLTAADT